MLDWKEYPRSVRQMGEPERSCRVYLEEYAESYIRKIPAAGPDGIHAGALFGKKMLQDGLPCYYIFGAIEARPVWEEGRLRFGQPAWRQIEQMKQEYFPGMEICGWFVRAETAFMPEIESLQGVQNTYFAEVGELLLTVSKETERFYRKGESLLYPLQGYYVFYQQNTAMQEYLTGEVKSSQIPDTGSRERESSEKMPGAVAAGAVGEAKSGSLSGQEGIISRGWLMKPGRVIRPGGGRSGGAVRSGEKGIPGKSSGTQEKAPMAGDPPASGGAPLLPEWQRRVVAVVLFLVLAAGVIFYGRPDRVDDLQEMISQQLFGTEAVPAAAEAETSQ